MEAADDMNVLIDTKLRPVYEIMKNDPYTDKEQLRVLRTLLISIGAFIELSQSLNKLNTDKQYSLAENDIIPAA